MAEFVTKVRVNKPVGHTFRVFLDEGTMAKWVSGFKGIEIVSGKPRKVDSLYRMMINFDGEVLQTYQKLLEVKEDERLLVQMEHPEFITYSEILFSKAGAATEMLCKVKIEGKTVKMKFAIRTDVAHVLPLSSSHSRGKNARSFVYFLMSCGST